MITLRDKIGQMLIMGFSGSEIHDKSPVAQWLAEDGLGGVLLFDFDVSTGLYGKNLVDQQQIKNLIQKLNYYSAQKASDNNDNLPLLTAIDYEGGSIDRLSGIDGCMATMSARDMARLSAKELDDELSQMADTLKSLGFNLNFAPIVDLHMHDRYGIIGALHRSFSADPEIVTRLAKQFVEVFHRYRIATCYKHFPGHGSALGDTHEGFVDVTETFHDMELAPYYQLAKDTHLPVMIMTAHVINNRLDSSGLPATLSHEILTGLLRNTMSYDGIIISDDLQMQSITDHYSLEEALCLTINAGADMIIFSNQLGNASAPEIIGCIEGLVLSKKIDMQRIDEAYRRVVRLKHQITL